MSDMKAFKAIGLFIISLLILRICGAIGLILRFSILEGALSSDKSLSHMLVSTGFDSLFLSIMAIIIASYAGARLGGRWGFNKRVVFIVFLILWSLVMFLPRYIGK